MKKHIIMAITISILAGTSSVNAADDSFRDSLSGFGGKLSETLMPENPKDFLYGAAVVVGIGATCYFVKQMFWPSAPEKFLTQETPQISSNDLILSKLKETSQQQDEILKILENRNVENGESEDRIVQKLLEKLNVPVRKNGYRVPRVSLENSPPSLERVSDVDGETPLSIRKKDRAEKREVTDSETEGNSSTMSTPREDSEEMSDSMNTATYKERLQDRKDLGQICDKTWEALEGNNIKLARALYNAIIQNSNKKIELVYVQKNHFRLRINGKADKQNRNF